MVTCGWTNARNEHEWEATRIWRNRNVARYLGIDYTNDSQLADALSSAFPTLKNAHDLISETTGITHFYKAFRTETLKRVRRDSEKIWQACETAAAQGLKAPEKISRAYQILDGLGDVVVSGKRMRLTNGLSPLIASLDPNRGIPIINSKTRKLLRHLGFKSDTEGALALSGLIGSKGIRHSFDLDVYANTGTFPARSRSRKQDSSRRQIRELGLKSELRSTAHLAKQTRSIMKRHNELTNQFLAYVRMRYYEAQEADFDAFLPYWKDKEHVLVEAKTAATGPVGRTQVRQGIGQLFDYQHTHRSDFPEGKVRLALLLPSEPPVDISELLRSLKIEVLWFESSILRGTIKI